jgi:hypothetical protein
MSGAKLPPHRSTLSFGIARRHRLRDWLGRRAGESTLAATNLKLELGKLGALLEAQGGLKPAFYVKFSYSVKRDFSSRNAIKSG